MECRDCTFLSEPKEIHQGDYSSVRCTLGLWDSQNKEGAPQWYSYGEAQLNRGPVKRIGATCTVGKYKSFDRWYDRFQKELAKQSGTGVIPKGMDKESYREAYEEDITPADRADQELDDLSR